MKPVSVKNGSVVVKIYHTPGPKYNGYTITYKTGTGRAREFHSTLAEAKTEAGKLAAKLAAGHGSVMEMTPEDARDMARIRRSCPACSSPI